MSHYDRFYQFSKPLIEGLKETFFSRFAFKALVQKPKKNSNLKISGNISSCLIINGKIDTNNSVRNFTGFMIISYPMSTFFKLAGLKDEEENFNEDILEIAKEIAVNVYELSAIELSEVFHSISSSEIIICKNDELTFAYPLPGETVLMEVVSKFGFFNIEFSYIEE